MDQWIGTWNNSWTQVLNDKFYNASAFESRFMQRFRFWIESFLKLSVFEEKFAFKKNTLEFHSIKTSIFAFFVLFFKKTTILMQFFFWKSQPWNEKIHKTSHFELKNLKGVRFLFNFFRTRHILNQNFHSVSDIESKFLTTRRTLNQNFYSASDSQSTIQRLRFWNYFFCSLSCFHAFTEIGYILGNISRFDRGSGSWIEILGQSMSFTIVINVMRHIR